MTRLRPALGALLPLLLLLSGLSVLPMPRPAWAKTSCLGAVATITGSGTILGTPHVCETIVGVP